MAKRKVLGKGLSALIPEANKLVDKEVKYFECSVDEIEPNPYQPRDDFSTSRMEEMVNSVKEKGVITPLLVNKIDSGYQLIAGERRWRAAKQAGLKHIPVVVHNVSPTESLELALIENIHRKDLNPIEEATAYKRLLDDSGRSQESLAKLLGKDRTTITNMLRLLNLPIYIQQDLIYDRLSMGHARLLAGIKDEALQQFLRDIIIKKSLTVRQAESLARAKQASAKKQPSQRQDLEMDYYIQSLADNLKRSFGTKVDIKRNGQKGKIILHFYSDDELDRLLSILN